MTADDSSNGRVTQADRMARIETRLDYIVQQLERQSAQLSDYPALRERVETHDREIATLRTRDAVIGWANAALAALAGIVGVQQR